MTPDWLAVALDEAEERGPEAWIWGWPKRANADAYADADAHADADADADAPADANACADAHASDANAYKQLAPLSMKGLNVRPGLYLYTSPSGDSVGVLRIAWLRRAPGSDPHEYEALNSTTPLRGEYTTMLGDAQDAPPPGWKWSPMLKRPSPIHRAQIRNPVALDEQGYAKVCPRPKDWDEVTP